MSDNSDRIVIQCNYRQPTNVAARGARAYLSRTNPGGGNDRIEILVRSRGGRWVRKWEDIRRLCDFRPKTLPPEHPLHRDERIWPYVNVPIETVENVIRQLQEGEMP